MVTVALLVRLEAKPGKESEVESFLNSGLALVQEEPDTTAWFAIRMGPSTFGIFDAFPDEAGRQVKLGIRAEDVDTRHMNQMLSGRVSSVLPVG